MHAATGTRHTTAPAGESLVMPPDTTSRLPEPSNAALTTGPPPGSRVHCSLGAVLNVAVTTLRPAPIVTSHKGPGLVQAPDRPPSIDGVAATISSCWPSVTRSRHVCVQV